MRKKSNANCLSPKGEFWHYLQQALDLSKGVSEQAQSDSGNNLLIPESAPVKGYNRL
jgi:hypothetical protein